MNLHREEGIVGEDRKENYANHENDYARDHEFSGEVPATGRENNSRTQVSP